MLWAGFSPMFTRTTACSFWTISVFWWEPAFKIQVFLCYTVIRLYSLPADSGAEPEIVKHLMSPRIDSKESIPPAYAAWRAGTITLFQIGS